jgi:Xaa-Pro aminopeptidase
MNHAARLGALQSRLDAPLLVSNLTNVRYLSGFTGSNAFLAVWPERAVFITDSRYGEAAAALVEQLPRTDLRVYQGALMPELQEVLRGTGRIQLEAENVTWGFSRRLGEAVDADLVAVDGVVEQLRLVKDDEEVEALRAAAAAGDAAFAALDQLVAASAVEAELGWALIDEMRSNGADPAGWPPIVAAGPGSSVPHYSSGPVPVDEGLLLLDYGCVVDGYHSDMSRTVWLGGAEPDAEMAKIHDIVAESQRAAIDRVAPGAKCSDIDEAVREVLRAYGHEEHFLHSTGHGVGLEIHEGPRVAQSSDEVLEVGHVITVEPGVYLPGVGGVRIEDMVLVTEDGPVELTSSPKELVRS